MIYVLAPCVLIRHNSKDRSRSGKINAVLFMHELPVTQGILDVAVEAARNNNAARITDIYLVIGDLTSIIDDSVQFYFDFLSKDTLAENAILHFERRPALATCTVCGHQTEVSLPMLPECQVCGSAQVTVSGGRDFYVDSIEID